MDPREQLRYLFPSFTDEIRELIVSKGKVMSLKTQQILLKEGYFVNAVPIVLDGLLKVTRREEDKEILLYYINPGESCIMSFSACIASTASKVFAITEIPTKILMIPSETLNLLIAKYRVVNNYFHKLYQDRYEELIMAIDQLVFMRFDERLYLYLKEKSRKLNSETVKITHQDIAGETGTVREVVSRALKKLEREGRLQLTRHAIKII